ncbi:MAG: transposase [Candidatus Omnitrophota bacterium]
MSRPYRLQGANCLYHITSRGDDRKRIFVNETDYLKFLEYLKAAKGKFKFYLYAYCLMGNHYHLFFETTQPNLSAIMHSINTAYTTYYNIKRQRCGHLFQGRYKSILVDADTYFLELTRYIHLNPVKAKMAPTPIEYKWSSYKGYLSQKGDGIIDKYEIKKYLDMTPKQYCQFVAQGIDKEIDPFKNVYAGFLLGPLDFIKGKLESLKEQVEGRDLSYKKELSINQVNEHDVIEAVAKHFNKSAEELLKMKSRPATEKKIAIYLIKQLTALTNNQTGKIFGITFSAVSKAARDVVMLMEEDLKIRKTIEGLISTFKA